MIKWFKRKKRNREHGFTIMEMVVTMVVMSVIMAAAQPFIKVQVDSFMQSLKAKFALQHVRIGMERVLSELRIADSFNSVSGNSIDFNNTRPNGRVLLEFDTFSYDGYTEDCLLYTEVGWTGLTRNRAMPLVGYVDLANSRFRCYDQNGNVTTTAADVQLVQITITLVYDGMTYKVTNQVAPLSIP